MDKMNKEYHMRILCNRLMDGIKEKVKELDIIDEYVLNEYIKDNPQLNIDASRSLIYSKEISVEIAELIINSPSRNPANLKYLFSNFKIANKKAIAFCDIPQDRKLCFPEFVMLDNFLVAACYDVKRNINAVIFTFNYKFI